MPVGVTAAMPRALERTMARMSDMLAIFGVACSPVWQASGMHFSSSYDRADAC